jgi:ABC-type glutathione transport system ATPase component
VESPGPRAGVLRRRGGVIRVVNGLDLEVGAGDLLWLVGPPGEGAAEAGLLLTGDLSPSAGSVEFEGRDLAAVRGRRRARSRRRLVRLDMVEAASLDPRRTAADIVAEAAAGSARSVTEAHRAEATDLLATLGIAGDSGAARTAALTQDDRHLVDAARVVALRPRAVVYRPSSLNELDDDPVWVALTGLRATSATALVVISEGLPPALEPGDRALVFCGGRVVEVLRSGDLAHPLHPYTVALRGLAAAQPTPGAPEGRSGRRSELGDGGCPFRSECPRAKARCATEVPRLSRPLGASHDVACHFPEDPRRPQGLEGQDGSGPVLGGGRGNAGTLPPQSDEPTAREFAEG